MKKIETNIYEYSYDDPTSTKYEGECIYYQVNDGHGKCNNRPNIELGPNLNPVCKKGWGPEPTTMNIKNACTCCAANNTCESSSDGGCFCPSGSRFTNENGFWECIAGSSTTKRCRADEYYISGADSCHYCSALAMTQNGTNQECAKCPTGKVTKTDLRTWLNARPHVCGISEPNSKYYKKDEGEETCVGIEDFVDTTQPLLGDEGRILGHEAPYNLYGDFLITGTLNDSCEFDICNIQDTDLIYDAGSTMLVDSSGKSFMKLKTVSEEELRVLKAINKKDYCKCIDDKKEIDITTGLCVCKDKYNDDDNVCREQEDLTSIDTVAGYVDYMTRFSPEQNDEGASLSQAERQRFALQQLKLAVKSPRLPPASEVLRGIIDGHTNGRFVNRWNNDDWPQHPPDASMYKDCNDNDFAYDVRKGITAPTDVSQACAGGGDENTGMTKTYMDDIQEFTNSINSILDNPIYERSAMAEFHAPAIAKLEEDRKNRLLYHCRACMNSDDGKTPFQAAGGGRWPFEKSVECSEDSVNAYCDKVISNILDWAVTGESFDEVMDWDENLEMYDDDLGLKVYQSGEEDGGDGRGGYRYWYEKLGKIHETDCHDCPLCSAKFWSASADVLVSEAPRKVIRCGTNPDEINGCTLNPSTAYQEHGPVYDCP